MKYCLKPFVSVLMLFICLAGPAVNQAADRLMFLKGSTIMQSSIDAMMALPDGGFGRRICIVANDRNWPKVLV